MTLCSKHGACRDSFCQRCQDIVENEQLQEDKRYLTLEVVRLEGELADTHRAWALLELDSMTEKAREWFLKGNGTTGVEAVDALIRAAAKDDCHVGRCKCGARAPLKRVPLGDYGDSEDVCAPGWGCNGSL